MRMKVVIGFLMFLLSLPALASHASGEGEGGNDGEQKAEADKFEKSAPEKSAATPKEDPIELLQSKDKNKVKEGLTAISEILGNEPTVDDLDTIRSLSPKEGGPEEGNIQSNLERVLEKVSALPGEEQENEKMVRLKNFAEAQLRKFKAPISGETVSPPRTPPKVAEPASTPPAPQMKVSGFGDKGKVEQFEAKIENGKTVITMGDKTIVRAFSAEEVKAKLESKEIVANGNITVSGAGLEGKQFPSLAVKQPDGKYETYVKLPDGSLQHYRFVDFVGGQSGSVRGPSDFATNAKLIQNKPGSDERNREGKLTSAAALPELLKENLRFTEHAMKNGYAYDLSGEKGTAPFLLKGQEGKSHLAVMGQQGPELLLGPGANDRHCINCNSEGYQEVKAFEAEPTRSQAAPDSKEHAYLFPSSGPVGAPLPPRVSLPLMDVSTFGAPLANTSRALASESLVRNSSGSLPQSGGHWETRPCSTCPKRQTTVWVPG